MLRRFALFIALTLGVVGCSANCGGVRPVLRVVVAVAGSGVQTLHTRHQEAYRAATDALRERSATLADYTRDVAPIDTAFRARSHAISLASASLYGAAGILDATRQGSAAQYRAAAEAVLGVLDPAIEILRDGSVLPAVPIPADVTNVIDQLRTLVRSLGGPNTSTTSDGGAE